MTCECETGLDRGHAAGPQFSVAFGKRRRELRESPGHSHQCISMFGQALSRDSAASVQCGRLIESWRQTRCRVKVLSVGEPLDREAVCGEGRGADRGDTGKCGQDLALGVGEQCHDFEVDGIDIAAESTVPVQIAVQPMSTLVGIGRWWQTSAPPLQPVLGGTGRQAPGGPAHQRSQLWWSSGKRALRE
jgi:hypothetical protein